MSQDRRPARREGQQPVALMVRILGQSGDRLGADRLGGGCVAGDPGQHRESARAAALRQAAHRLDPDRLVGRVEEPLQEPDRQRGMVGPEHPQAATDDRGRGAGFFRSEAM